MTAVATLLAGWTALSIVTCVPIARFLATATQASTSPGAARPVPVPVGPLPRSA